MSDFFLVFSSAFISAWLTTRISSGVSEFASLSLFLIGVLMLVLYFVLRYNIHK